MLAYAEWRELYHAGKLNETQKHFFEPRAAEALYDIENDPYETKNLATDPAFAATTAQMRNRLREIVKGLPDLSLYPESYLADHAFDAPVSSGQSHQADLILNTLVLLRDGNPGYKFDVSLDQLKSLKEKQADGVQRRIEYLISP